MRKSALKGEQAAWAEDYADKPNWRLVEALLWVVYRDPEAIAKNLGSDPDAALAAVEHPLSPEGPRTFAMRHGGLRGSFDENPVKAFRRAIRRGRIELTAFLPEPGRLQGPTRAIIGDSEREHLDFADRLPGFLPVARGDVGTILIVRESDGAPARRAFFRVTFERLSVQAAFPAAVAAAKPPPEKTRARVSAPAKPKLIDFCRDPQNLAQALASAGADTKASAARAMAQLFMAAGGEFRASVIEKGRAGDNVESAWNQATHPDGALSYAKLKQLAGLGD